MIILTDLKTIYSVMLTVTRTGAHHGIEPLEDILVELVGLVQGLLAFVSISIGFVPTSFPTGDRRLQGGCLLHQFRQDLTPVFQRLPDLQEQPIGADRFDHRKSEDRVERVPGNRGHPIKSPLHPHPTLPFPLHPPTKDPHPLIPLPSPKLQPLSGPTPLSPHKSPVSNPSLK